MKIFFTVVITIVSLLVLGVVFIYSGIYNVAASKGDNPLVHWVLSTTMEHSVENHAHSEGQIEASENLSGGCQEFLSNCIICHGSPTQQRWKPVQSMTPEPPELHKAAKELSLAELIWIVEHGIKMTGMPAFGPTHSRKELVEIATFVDTLPAITVSEFRQFVDSLGLRQTDTINSYEHSRR